MRKLSGSSFLMPGTSTAATTASNSRTSASLPATMPVTRVGLPCASTSCTRSRMGVRRCSLAPRSSRYEMIGSCRYVCGEPSSMRSTDASVRIAKSMKIVSMQRA